MTEEIDSRDEFDLALSTLLQYGFSKVRIKRTITNILQLYNGNEAWPLIKENGYEVVLERLLSDERPKRSKSQGKEGGNAAHAEKKSRASIHADNRAGQLAVDKEAYAEEQSKSTPDVDGVLKLGEAEHVQEQSNSCAADDRVCHSFDLKSGDLPGPPSLADVENLDIYLHQRISWSSDAAVATPAWLTTAAPNAPKKVHQKLLHLNDLADSPAPWVERDARGVDKNKQGQGSRKKRQVLVVLEEAGPSYKGVEKNQNEQALGQGVEMKKQVLGAEEHDTRVAIPIKPSSTAVGLENNKEREMLTADQAEAPGAFEAESFNKRMQVSVPSKSFKCRATAQAKAQRTTNHPAAEAKQSEPTMVDLAIMPNDMQHPERLDIARISACKLTRRRDGAPNPMFSRLQKLKQQHGSSNRAENQKRAERSVSNRENQPPIIASKARENQVPLQGLSQLLPGSREWDGIQQSALSNRSEDTQESPELPPGCWDPAGASEEAAPCRGDPEHQDDTLVVPPGCWEPSDSLSSEESPRLPPGFWKPCGEDERGVGVVASCPAVEHNEGLQSDRSPELPPGFWNNSDTPGSAYGSGEPSSFFWMTSSKAEGSIDGVGSKGTPPKQIFIANIPEGCEGAEQILYGLVRKVLAGFKSIPIDATLPRSIRVRGDHAFVEFSSEAFAGIFLDAYHAQPCVLKIGEEQLVAARSMQRMRTDIQLQHAVAGHFQNQALDPNNVFFLGNVPAEWQNEERLGSHLGSLLEGVMSGSSPTPTRPLSVHTFPAFSVAYVHIAGSMLADAFFLRCFSHREHMEAICTSLIVCRNSTCLPSAARVSLGH